MLFARFGVSPPGGQSARQRRYWASCGEWTIRPRFIPPQDFQPAETPTLPLIAVLMHACSLAALLALAPKRPVPVIRVTATVEAALCPAMPTAPAGSRGEHPAQLQAGRARRLQGDRRTGPPFWRPRRGGPDLPGAHAGQMGLARTADELIRDFCNYYCYAPIRPDVRC